MMVGYIFVDDMFFYDWFVDFLVLLMDSSKGLICFRMVFLDVKVVYDKFCDMIVGWQDGWMFQFFIKWYIIQLVINFNYVFVNNGV